LDQNDQLAEIFTKIIQPIFVETFFNLKI
jgi:hypothetical protein